MTSRSIEQGTRLGRYEIRSQLGAGGMGEVYRAIDTELDRTVAIKILPAAVASDHQRLQRFIQEAKAASALNHPHILTIHEIGTTGTTRFIATEFIDGVTLRERIKAGMKLTEILETAIQTVNALAAAHSAGIIHRDIKPENIMVRRDGYIKVLDFGLAKLTEPKNATPDTDALTRAMVNTGAGTVIGTATYMSPEQAKGIPVDERTDLWSVGAVLYEMITGRVAFAGETPTETISLILQKEPPAMTRFAPEVPGELERIVNKALTKDREERYQTAKDLLIDLRNLKRKIEVDAELDRTAAPELASAGLTTGEQITPATGSGIRLQGMAPQPSSAEYIVSGIKKHRLAAIVALTAIVLAAAALFIYRRNTEAAIDSIAVLPFQNRSTEADTEYLADGLAESLIYRLSQLPNLRVSPTSSVFRYKGKDIDPVKVGHELGVNAVLSGRIVQRGDDLTISAELVDVRDNKLRWGEQYQRKMSELLATQREIAREIVEKLKLSVSKEEKGLTKHYTDSNEAYQLYLKGRFAFNKRTESAMKKSLEYYQQAIEKDPNFAIAYSGMADTYSLLGASEAGGGMVPNDVLPKAKAAALKALEIDESLAEPHVSLGHVTCFYDRKFTDAEREFRRAIELNPSYAQAHHWYAIYLSAIGRQPEALSEIRRAQDLDPLSLPIAGWVGRILDYAGQSDAAIAQLHKTIELDPTFAQAHLWLGTVLERRGMYSDAIAEFQQLIKLSERKPAGLAALARTYASAGKREESQKLIEELQRLSHERYVSPTSIAIVYAALGNKDEAFRWLDQGDKAHDTIIIRLKTDWRFEPLRSDPRFAELVRRLGLPDS